MPPSPSLRCSPGREPRANHHRRGQSFESGVFLKEKDEDLALFNEMQTREKEDFLLQSDDLEVIFSTNMRQFSDVKLGITIPTRGESSDLFNVEGEKNDYDWLVTPPDTPLFPSLDDEPPPVNAPQRGRPRSQPISISRSSTMEKSYRSSRGSASPNRLSPSPRSGNSTIQSRGQPSPVRHSSPTPSLRPATPSRRPSTPSPSRRPSTPSPSRRPSTPSQRPSTPPSKSPTPPPRSSTPTPRRMSTGSSSTGASPGTRGTSPAKTSRGNSASPKIRAWQTNIPGFSCDAPPNLRTSLADRPATYVRGSSPASRNGRDNSSNYRRKSMSPTASRSVSSSHSHDLDPFSSHSKGSIASSGDDDLDSLQSLPVGSLDRSTSRRVGTFSNNRAVAFSKRPAKVVSSSSAPKRYFDSALRQMDQRKGPQNMFRPLLSSVPTSTFYVGTANSAHRPLISRNSSVTTSSNASTDLGTSVAHDAEGSDHNQDDMASESEKVPYSDVHEEIFGFDKMDVVDENTKHDFHDGSHDIHHGDFNGDTSTVECGAGHSEDYGHPDNITEVSRTSEDSHVKGDFSEVNNLKGMEHCLKCGRRYYVSDEVERNIRFCPECRTDKLLTVLIPEITEVPESSPSLSVEIVEEEKHLDAKETMVIVPGSPQVSDLGILNKSQGEENVGSGETIDSEQIPNYLQEESLVKPVEEGVENGLANQQEVGALTVGCSQPNSATVSPNLHHFNNYTITRADISEGAGISILLKRTSSPKGDVVQGRTLTATTIPYEDLSYARDSSNSMRSSIGHASFSASSSFDFGPARQTETRVQRQLSSKKSDMDSFSASSSVDYGSARQTETRVQRQLSGKKSDMENHRHDTNTKTQSVGSSDMENHRNDTNMKPQSIGSSSSYGDPNHAYQTLGLLSNTHDDDLEVTVGNVEYDVAEVAPMTSQKSLLASECTEPDVTATASARTTVVKEDDTVFSSTSRRFDASTTELSNHAVSTPLEENWVAPGCENYASDENGEESQNHARSATDLEISVVNPDSFKEENTTLNSSVDRVDAEKSNHSAHCSMNSDASIESKSTIEECQEPSVPIPSDSDMTPSVPENTTSNNAYGILEEESTVMVEYQGRSKTRSLTLEEATDTILFCSSIVHDLAYEAAAIAMEKETSVPLDGFRPTVTILGKSNPERKEPRGRTVSRRSLKPQKGKPKQLETDAELPASKTENDENVDESLQRNVGLPKVDSMKPPKLESKCNCTIM
ncbi:uncharacterized protein LOC126596562 [Malus sylvestris]|uniref:uncharacterized protein LOC126596562 n=1 Tax=Malus sylvestris TaxID=3752 RepID=UPI0021AC9C02|nr:uncharacterized protein LOC126596562 [Malus sylvestris]